MLLKYRFFDSERLPYGDFSNDFIDNGNGTVTDRATGLVWQKKGSIKSLARREATRYVEKLNKEPFVTAVNRAGKETTLVGLPGTIGNIGARFI